MRLFYVRGIGVLGLMALFLYVPSAAIVALAVGYTYLALRARQHAIETEHFVSLNLS